MPYFEYSIQDATNSKTDNERWGDYAGMGVELLDNCTFWFTTEYGGDGQTKIASFKFDSCSCEIPGAPLNLIATANGDNSIYLQWSQGSPYYYIVRAVDSSNGMEETNTTILSGVPTGPINLQNFNETFEAAGGFDNPGWTHQAMTGTVDWQWSTAQSNTPTHSWFSASQSSISDRVLTTPPFSVISNTTMSFYHTYDFEGSTSSCYDAGTLEYSTDGTNWVVIPDNYFISGGFNGTVSSSYSNPIGGKKAWCGGTIGAMTQVLINLGALSGSTIYLRFHAGEDSSIADVGWYLDFVQNKFVILSTQNGNIAINGESTKTFEFIVDPSLWYFTCGFSLSDTTNLTDCVKVELIAPDNSASILKDYGQAVSSPYSITSFYGKKSCDLLSSSIGGNLREIANFNMDSGINGTYPILYLLLTVDNGFGT